MKRYIDAYYIQNKLTNLYKNSTGSERIAYRNALDIICDADTEAEVQEDFSAECGNWVDSSNGWMCSKCFRDFSFDVEFCPNCNAKMSNGR